MERPIRRRSSASGHQVGAPQPVQLDAVLQGAQEAVRRRQGRRVVAPDVPPRRQRLKGDERAAAAQVDVGLPWTSCSSCTENSTSRSPPAPSLSWRSASRAGMCPRPGGAWPARPRRSADGWPPATPSAPGPRRSAPEVEVARDRAGLEQGLELPGLGPALVVADVAASVRTSAPDLPSGRSPASTSQIDPSAVCAEQAASPAGQPGRGGQRRGLVDALRRRRDEHHVHVGDVVQLAAAALAHGDHGEPRRAPGGSSARATASAA